MSILRVESNDVLVATASAEAFYAFGAYGFRTCISSDDADDRFHSFEDFLMAYGRKNLIELVVLKADEIIATALVYGLTGMRSLADDVVVSTRDVDWKGQRYQI